VSKFGSTETINVVTVTRIETQNSVVYEVEAGAGEPARLLAEAIGEVITLDESAGILSDIKLVFSSGSVHRRH
jgi:hypothetical protein